MAGPCPNGDRSGSWARGGQGLYTLAALKARFFDLPSLLALEKEAVRSSGPPHESILLIITKCGKTVHLTNRPTGPGGEDAGDTADIVPTIDDRVAIQR